MNNLSAVKRRSSSVPGPAASTLGLATTRQSHNLASVISGQYVRAGISSPFRLRMMYPRLQSFTRTKASLLGSLALLASLFSVSAFVERPTTSVPTPFLDVGELERTRSGNLPLFEHRHQRYYGVVDTLER
jgi:hypothetical protein